MHVCTSSETKTSTNSVLARKPLWSYLFWAPFSNVVYVFSNPVRKWSLSKNYWRYSVKKHLTRTPWGPVPACQKVGNMHTVTRMFFHVHLTEYKNTNLCKLLRVYRQWYAVKYDQYSKSTQQDFGFNFPCLVIMAQVDSIKSSRIDFKTQGHAGYQW